jgi:nucleoid DNA-binding protein
MRLELGEIYAKVSAETGISKSKIELAFKSVFETVADTMREEKGDNILLPKFGKFVVPLRKLRYVNTEKYTQQFSRYYGGVEEPGNQESQSGRSGAEEVGGL